mmetsp:Transcript_2420/g.3022  ORF Transcript_2420/g.3022 Transcript_2420/m.3022 type:complete len:122 (+) Transcript_2420:4285-4650(+)
MIERPKNFAEGFGYGCMATVTSLKSAVTGIVKRPYIETKRYGVSGMVKGVWAGATGIILKPVSGTLDLISKQSEGIKNTAKVFDAKVKKDRVRMPRPLYGFKRLIKPYSKEDALFINIILA